MPRRINVKVHPKARLQKVEEDGVGGFRVWTTAPPDKGAANDAVRRLLADALGIPVGRITLRLGATSRNKVFEIDSD